MFLCFRKECGRVNIGQELPNESVSGVQRGMQDWERSRPHLLVHFVR